MTREDEPNAFPVSVADDDSWRQLIRELDRHAHQRLHRYGYTAQSLASTSDYVQEAVERMLDGRRRFSGRTMDDLRSFLCGVIDSLVSHDAERTLHRGRSVSVWLETDDPDEPFVHPSYEIETEMVARDELDRFLSVLEPELRAYVRLRLEAECSARDYAAALHVTAAQIRNLDRRLQRRRRLFAEGV